MPSRSEGWGGLFKDEQYRLITERFAPNAHGTRSSVLFVFEQFLMFRPVGLTLRAAPPNSRTLQNFRIDLRRDQQS